MVCWPSRLELNAVAPAKPLTTSGGEFALQHRGTPPAVSAEGRYGAAPIAIASVRPGTGVGLRRSPASATGPRAPVQPQQLTVPAAWSAHAKPSRTLTAVTSVSPGTATGTGLPTRVPVPSTP